MLACLGLGSKKSSKAKKQASKWTSEEHSPNNQDFWHSEDFSDGELDLTPTGSHESVSSNDPQKLFAGEEKAEDKLVAVIVTISEGSSYDPNFSEMEPQTVPGERISTYAISCLDVGKLHGYLAGHEAVPPAPSAWPNLIEDVRSVPADSVTFNWECCSGCSDSGFPGRSGFRMRASTRGARSFNNNPAVASPTMQLMGLALSSGYTVMCSDFSMKALISEWSEEHLGPNPFMKMSVECNEQFQLDFIPAELQNEEVPQQLQVVGELCAEQGKAIVQAMGGTIVYTVNPHRPPTNVYDLKVLTVVSDWGMGDEGLPEAMKCSVGDGGNEKRGAAGHVTLTYSSGGQLLTSMGHWIELTRIDTSLEAVARVAAHNFGEAQLQQFNMEYNCLRSDTERRDHLQRWSKEMVQKSVPTRMKCRTKY